MTCELWRTAAFIELGLMVVGGGIWLWANLDVKFRLAQLRQREIKDMARIDELESYLVSAGIAVKVERPDPIHATTFIGLYGDSYKIPEPEKTAINPDPDVQQAALEIWEAGVKKVTAATPTEGNTGEATSEVGSDG